ncbi:MAG TPA: amino acid adenylation domain-containing protein [Aliidongia sp.]|nr:amino acid adenylation domain-containing protein [Aliidongia sp.]
MNEDEKLLGPGIAIIGIAGRFPGADTAEALWENICAGVESITRFTDADLDDWLDASERQAPNYVKARPILKDVERFDPEFFGMYANEAALTDPQHRVFLECSWQALEDGGYDPAAYPGAIGVFAGCSMNTYFLNNVCADRRTVETFTTSFQVGCYSMLVGGGREFLATRVAYKLGLTGPAITVQTACSTSLVAVGQACQSLLLYQSDMALAGGASITFPQQRGYMHQEGGLASADGHCRAFDAAASGTVFGSGAGVVLLKRLEDAVADGDRIYAVIRGIGMNNDGATKVGFTAPSADGQAVAIEQALALAGVDARDISYVECHGTATPLGDPIEIAGLTKAFRKTTDDRQFCAIGSVKTNVGHLDAAAGVTSLIKTALALKHGVLPPTLHYQTPNPQIDFEASPFFVNTALTAWPAGNGPRRAGVSSFGVGGTNAHVVMEEAPAAPEPVASEGPQLLVLSARTAPALAEARARLADHMRRHPEANLADIAATLQSGRRRFKHRLALVCRDREEALAKLGDGGQSATAETDTADPASLAFLFPGQGAQYPQMGRDLYDNEPAFREAVDACAEILLSLSGVDIRSYLYPEASGEAPAKALMATLIAQPAIFTVEYALARLWQSWGLKPATMIGHSIGEFVVACLAGVFTLEDALRIVAARGRLMQDLPGGAMLAVRLSRAEVEALLPAALAVAAVNGPTLSVVAGSYEAIAAFQADLEARGTFCRLLATSHAFHSPMMDPMVDALRQVVASVTLSPPSFPYVSTVTGGWIDANEAASADYWARHAREPVLFHTALTTLFEQAKPVLLEVGPGTTLTNLARQAIRGIDQRTAASLPDPSREVDDRSAALAAVGDLWAAGVQLDFAAIRRGQGRRISLPTYPFQRTRHWIDPPARSETAVAQPSLAQTTMQAPPEEPPAMLDPSTQPSTSDSWNAELRSMIKTAIEELSGESLANAEPGTSFLEMGFDSLFLGQVAQRLQNQTKIKISFRQLLKEQSTIEKLADFLAERMPAPAAKPAASPAPLASPAAAVAAAPIVAAPALQPAAVSVGGGIEGLFRDQMNAMKALFDLQLQTLRQVGQPMPATVAPVAIAPAAAPVQPAVAAAPVPPPAEEAPSRFQVYKAGAKSAATEATPAQRAHLESLIARYVQKSAGSKRLTGQYRPSLADPRAAAGFRAEWKEMVYPIVCARSHGSKIWDVDGNEYIDLVNGYGQTAFGHAPEFVTKAVAEQMERGFAIGPQADLAGRISVLFREMTGNERMTFCNTGSEAVMAALRVARAVTGRTKVVVFNGAYHGQFDEVLVKGVARATSNPRSLPVAPGIPDSAVGNMVVLDYATPEALEWIRAHADDLAAVVVEPVQSRHPALRPVDFLKAVREITEASGTAFIMDEVVTGFRVHPGGMQAVMGIRADMATYGKVVGGGLPIGILAGKAAFMDALDGGAWQYGDASVPEAAVTFFAGTFVRHPLTLAATWAVLNHLKDAGPALQEQLADRSGRLVDRLRGLFQAYGVPAPIENFSSFFYFNLHSEHPLASLLFHHLRYRGIHIQDGFPCFLTTAHSDADMDTIVRAFDESLAELAEVGIFGKPEEAAAAVATAAASTAAPVVDQVPLTESQMEIWLSAQLGDEASCAFNESVTLSLDGMLDRQALQDALDLVVARHESLRARFSPTGEWLRIAAPEPFRYEFHDLVGSGIEARFGEIVDQDARTAFDLVNGPVLRGHLVRFSADRHALVLTAHHIVADGWSINVVVSELAEIYAAKVKREALSLPEPLRFSEYTMREHDAISGPERATTEAYWLAKFERLPAPLELPTDRPRAAVKSFSGASRSRRIDAQLHQALKAAGAARECTLFVTLLAAFEALVGRLADQTEVVIGVPTAGQSLIDDEAPLVGHCVNFLPVRGGWKTNTTLAEHMRKVAGQVLEAYEHQNYTFGTLVRKLAMEREMNRLPLTEVQFNLERLSERLDLPGLTMEIQPNAKAFVNFDIFLNVIESKQGLRLDCDYNTDLWDAATIDRWLDYYEGILRSIARDADGTVPHAEMLPAAEREWLLAELNATEQPFPADACVDQLVEELAARRPDRTAVIAAGRRLSYRELNEAANRMAHAVLEQVERPGALVGICVERSAEMLVAMLGVLKAGCAYVPLDPNHPYERRRLILAEAGVAALITDDAEMATLVSAGTAIIDPAVHGESGRFAATAPSIARASSQLAYVIYTSGSTGRPKGVEIQHRAVVNLLTSMAREPGFGSEDVLLAVTTIAFDIAALELFLPLIAGGTVAIASPDEVRDGFKLRDALSGTGATMMQATPATWRLLLEAGFTAAPGFKMLCGGEALPRELATQLLQAGGRLWNMYGPTETTIWSSCAEITADTAEITIGSPIANTQFYVLDRFDELAPIGVPGQLHIGGEGLARGYFKSQDLTLDKFIANPFGGPSPRLYRTGDVARRSASGAILLSGRMDNQVKLRGFRIELGDIEAVLGAQDGVAACAVALRNGPSGAPQLVGYIVARDHQSLAPAQLRSGLAEQLPDYMVPSAWVVLDALPLSANGKLDRAALPTPEATPVEADQDQPISPLEARILEIWKDVLKLDAIGTNDDLLDLGADSIHFFQITARANREGIQIAAKQLLKHRTISGLAAFIEMRNAPETRAAGTAGDHARVG